MACAKLWTDLIVNKIRNKNFRVRFQEFISPLWTVPMLHSAGNGCMWHLRHPAAAIYPLWWGTKGTPGGQVLEFALMGPPAPGHVHSLLAQPVWTIRGCARATRQGMCNSLCEWCLHSCCWEGLTLAYSAGKNCVINPPGLNQWLFWSSNKNAKSLSPHRQTMHYCVQQRINQKTWQIANVRAVWQKQKSFSALSDNLSKLFLG